MTIVNFVFEAAYLAIVGVLAYDFEATIRGELAKLAKLGLQVLINCADAAIQCGSFHRLRSPFGGRSLCFFHKSNRSVRFAVDQQRGGAGTLPKSWLTQTMRCFRRGRHHERVAREPVPLERKQQVTDACPIQRRLGACRRPIQEQAALKLEQTSRSRTCPSWKSSSSRRRSLSKPGISSAAAKRSAGSLERTNARCSSMSSRIVNMSSPAVYGGGPQNGRLQPLEQQ